jgi:cell division protein FtsL
MSIIKTLNFPLLVQQEKDRIFNKNEVRKYLVCALFLTFFLTGLLFYLWPNMAMLQTGFQYSRLQTEKENLIEKNNALRLEISSLMSLGRIERIARNELNMTDPVEDQLIYVKAVEDLN